MLPEGLKDAFGWGVSDAAREELKQSTERGFDRSGNSITRGFFETFRDRLIGNDPEAIRKRAVELYEEGITKSPEYLKQQENINRGLLPNVQSGFANPNETAAQAQVRIGSNNALADATNLAILENPNFDKTRLGEVQSIGDLSPLIQDARREKKAEEEEIARNTPEAIRARGQADRMEQRLNASIEESNKRFAIQQQQLAQDRLSNLELRKDKLDMDRQAQMDRMTMFQQQLENDNYNRKQDRMSAIMSGLATLGTAFAIT